MKYNLNSRIDVLDYARFTAAMGVMLFHYSYAGSAYGGTPYISHIPGLANIGKYGYFGVEFFFMISGFVIFISLKGRSASQFAVARALRLYPAFFTGVLLTSVVTWAWGGHLNRLTLNQVAANLTMYPSLFGQRNVDGSYWSLIVELKFYAFVFFMILLGLTKHLEKMFFIWPIIMLAAYLIGIDPLLSLSGYCCYFCAGVLFAVRCDRRDFRINTLLLVCLFFSYQLSAVKNLEIRNTYPLLPMVVAVIVFSFYAFFWLLSNGKFANLKLPLARQLGQVTYPLYLIHGTIGFIIINHFANEGNKLYVILGTIVAMPLLGFALHYCVEARLRNVWHDIFKVVIGVPVAFLETRLKRVIVQRNFSSKSY